MEKKSVLVTGASGGIGRACVARLLEHGHGVTALDLGREALTEASPESDSLALYPGDVSSPDVRAGAVEAAVSRFGRLDALIHLAAAHSSLRWDELTADEWTRVLAVNVTGGFLMSQAAARHMVGRGTGAIVLTASGVILSGGAGGEGRGGPAYASSKGAVIALTRSLARSLGASGVRVNVISPGNVETPMIAGYTPEARAAAIQRPVLGRIGEPEEIAAVAMFLISDEASYITGENVHVNGGSSFA